MKIDKKTMIGFLKKVNMNGDLNEAVFDFTETGLKISGKNAAGVTRIDAILKSSSFSEYNALGKIGVQEISTIIRIINTFNKEIEMIIEGNLLTLKESSKKVSIELLDIQFIEEVNNLPEMTFEESLKMKAEDINSFIKDASVNKEFFISLTTKEKVTMLSNTGKFKFSKTFETVETKGGVNVKFGTHFINAVTSLTDNILISTKTDYPIKLVETTEKSIISVITAPVTEDDEGDTKASGEQIKDEEEVEEIEQTE